MKRCKSITKFWKYLSSLRISFNISQYMSISVNICQNLSISVNICQYLSISITPLYSHHFWPYFDWQWSIKWWWQSIATFYCCRSLVKWSKPRIIYIFFILFGLKGTNQLFATKSHLKLMKSGLFPQICPFLSTVRRKSFLPP